ncbi:MAG: Gfo/Idh/MocA family oxidoreductase [Lentisphaerae bacterium]|nr:Gfo/Idh/MocA family oxidoreductase [Lentisphaerota bacterium]
MLYERNAYWAMAAMEAGVPVLCEKPIATTRAQLAQLKETASRTGGLLFTEFSFRCRPAVLAAQQAVQAGRIGEVVLATGQKSYKFGGKRPAWYGDRAMYGGTIGWVASHAIDALWFCTRCPFTEVTGHQGNLTRRDYPDMEDHTVSLFRLANGGTGMVHADFLRPEPAPSHGDDRLRIVGTAGQLEMRNNRTILISGSEGVRDLTSQAEALTMHGQVIAAINGKPSVLSTADSLYIAEVLLAAREAADNGNWVRIGPPC